jgi:hypothetical protein
MCHESFYPSVTKAALAGSSCIPQTVSMGSSAESSTLSSGSGGNTSLNSRDVITSVSPIEYASLEAPYCVPRPVRFSSDSVLMVSVVSVTGLSKKSNWTAQLSVDNTSENMPLQWDASRRYMSPRNDDAAFSMPTQERLQWTARSKLQIRLFESRIRRRIPGRTACTMSLPLRNLRPQESPARYTRVTIPCSHNDDAKIVLDVAWQSDYAVWAARELEARQRQHFSPVEAITPDKEDLENQYPWDWICHVC